MRAFIRAMRRRHAEGLPLDRHSVASFFVSRVDTEVDKRLAALGREDLQGRAGLANARAAYQAFKRVFGGERVRRAARGRAPGAAAAVGLHRRQEPGLPRDAVRLRARRPGHGQHDAAAHAAGRGRAGRGDGRHGGRRTRAPDLAALAEAGIDLDDVTDQLLREGIEAFVVPMNKLLGGIEAKREAIVTGAPAVVRGRPADELEQPVAARLRKAAERGRRAPHLGQGRHAVGAAGHARGRRPARLADDRRQSSRPTSTRSRVRARGARRTGITDVRAARHGRLEPRARGLPPLEPAVGGRAAPARARLDRAARGRARSSGAIDLDADAVHRLVEVGRDDRAQRAVRALPRAAARRPRTSSRSPTRARAWPSWPSARASAARSSPTRRSAAATRRCRRSGSSRRARRRRRRRRVLDGAQVAAENCEPARGQLRPLARRARSASWRCQGRDKLTFVVDPPLASFGLWAEQLVAESTGKQGRGILPIADEPLVDPSRLRARPRVRAPARRRRARPAPRARR